MSNEPVVDHAKANFLALAPQFDELVSLTAQIGPVTPSRGPISLAEERDYEFWGVSNLSESRHFHDRQSETAQALGLWSIEVGREYMLHSVSAVKELLGPADHTHWDDDHARVHQWDLWVLNPAFAPSLRFRVVVDSGGVRPVLVIPKDQNLRDQIAGKATREQPFTASGMQALWFQISLHRALGGKLWVDFDLPDWDFRRVKAVTWKKRIESWCT